MGRSTGSRAVLSITQDTERPKTSPSHFSFLPRAGTAMGVSFRAGVAWGLGSLGALFTVMVVLTVNLGHPVKFIGAQRPGSALDRPRRPGCPGTGGTPDPARPLAAWGVLPVVALGVGGLGRWPRLAARYLAPSRGHVLPRAARV